MSFPDIETVYIVEEPGMDRRTLWLRMSEEFYNQVKARGGKVFKINILMIAKQASLVVADQLIETGLVKEMTGPP